MENEKKILELSDQQMEQVAGGELNFGGDGFCHSKEDVVFRFKIGDRVETKNGSFFKQFTRRGTISYLRIDYIRGVPNLGEEDGCKPCYLVKLDEGSEEWFYEDEISY